MNGYMELDEKTLKELHRIQLEMLIDFVDACKKLDLKYFLICGSALGAVRHKGFIPWDDDIDIGMPRNDYERFITEGQKLLNSNTFIQTHRSDSEYPHNFAKIRNSKTTYIEFTKKNINMNHGVYIDIFPLDGVSKSYIGRLFFTIANKIYAKKVDEAFDLSIYAKNQNFKNIFFELIVKILFRRKSYKEIVVKRDKLLRKRDYYKSNYIANYCGAWGNKEICHRSFFGEGQEVKFENIEVVIPKEYDLYLKQVYGNYMKLPHIDKRKSHHYCSKIDLNAPYTKYISF